MQLILIILIILLVFGGRGGWVGYQNWGVHGGIGIPAVVIIALLLWVIFGRG